jgi:DnaJ-class molecular chaperone
MSEQSLARPARSGSREERREDRPCHSCYGSGTVIQDATYDFETGELIQALGACPICRGAGEISVYRYPKVRRSR